MTKESHAIPLREATFRLTLQGGAPKLSAVSNGVQVLLGYSAEDFLSGKVALPQLIHPDDRDIAEILFSPALPSNEGNCNLRLRQAGGRILCVKGHYRHEATADGVILDLRLQDAKSLPRTMAGAATMPNFAAMMENTDDYIYFKDRNHVFTGASQTLVSLCSPATHWTDLLGQTDYDVFPEKFADLYYRLEKQVFAGIPVAHEVQETLGKDGQKGWVDNRKYPIRDVGGAIIGLYGIARDITELKQAENNARQSHELLANLTRLVPGVVYQYRLFPDGRSAFSYSSPGMNDIYEVTPEEVQEDATPVFGRLHPDDSVRVGDLIQESARTLQTFYCEFRVILPRQGLRWRLSQAQPERMEDGGTLWHGIISDITERKQAEAALVASEARAHSIIEASPVPMALNDGSQRITYLNRAFTQTFGYALEDIPTLADWWPQAYPDPAYRQQVAEGWKVELDRAKQTGTAFTPLEVRIRCRDGTERFVLASAAVLSADVEEVDLVSLVDITTRKQAEESQRQDAAQADRMRRALLSTLEDQKRAQTAMRESEVRYGAMVHSISDAIISADSAGNIVGWNPGAERIFGYPASAILGQSLTLLLPARHHDRHHAGLAQVVAGGPHHIIGTTVEVEGRRKDGSEFPLNLSLSEWQIGSQKFFTAIIRDITAHKAEEANLAAKMEELRRWQGATLGREGRVLELKREINALRASHGEPPRYPSVLAEGKK